MRVLKFNLAIYAYYSGAMSGYEVVRVKEIGDSDKDLIRVSEYQEVEFKVAPAAIFETRIKEIEREIEEVDFELLEAKRRLSDEKDALLKKKETSSGTEI